MGHVRLVGLALGLHPSKFGRYLYQHYGKDPPNAVQQLTASETIARYLARLPLIGQINTSPYISEPIDPRFRLTNASTQISHACSANRLLPNILSNIGNIIEYEHHNIESTASISIFVSPDSNPPDQDNRGFFYFPSCRRRHSYRQTCPRVDIVPLRESIKILDYEYIGPILRHYRIMANGWSVAY